MDGIWKFLWSNIFIWSAMNVPLINFFHNVSQSLPNPKFVSILGKKVIFSIHHFLKRTSIQHIYSCFLVFSYDVSIIKSKIWNVFCPVIFLHFRMVWSHGIMFGRTLFESCVQKDTLHYVRKVTFQNRINTTFWTNSQISTEYIPPEAHIYFHGKGVK